MRLMAYNNAETEEAEPAEALFFDGYQIAERLLEGCVFKVELKNGELKVAPVEDWPRGLLQEYWIHEALHWLRCGYELSTTPDMKNDDGFIEFGVASGGEGENGVRGESG